MDVLLLHPYLHLQKEKLGLESFLIKEVPLMERPSGYDHLPFKYRIMKFEIEKEVLEQGYDIGPHEMLDYKDVVVDSEAEMEKILLEWVGELEQLDAPWYSDYPL